VNACLLYRNWVSILFSFDCGIAAQIPWFSKPLPKFFWRSRGGGATSEAATKLEPASAYRDEGKPDLLHLVVTTSET